MRFSRGWAEHQGCEAADDSQGSGQVELVALAGAALSFGRILSATMRAAVPTGTLIQKMSCQPAQVVTAPPTKTPAAIPRLRPAGRSPASRR